MAWEGKKHEDGHGRNGMLCAVVPLKNGQVGVGEVLRFAGFCVLNYCFAVLVSTNLQTHFVVCCCGSCAMQAD